MNMVSCGEQNCRYQIDGCCTRSDLTVNVSEGSAVGGQKPAMHTSGCCYFEQR